MKVNFTDHEVKKIVPYPKLMISKDGDMIVLFARKNHGTVLWDEEVEPGEHSTVWDMDQFEDYNGTITLSNQ